MQGRHPHHAGQCERWQAGCFTPAASPPPHGPSGSCHAPAAGGRCLQIWALAGIWDLFIGDCLQHHCTPQLHWGPRSGTVAPAALHTQLGCDFRPHASHAHGPFNAERQDIQHGPHIWAASAAAMPAGQLTKDTSHPSPTSSHELLQHSLLCPDMHMQAETQTDILDSSVQAVHGTRLPSPYAELLQHLDHCAGSIVARHIDAQPELSEPGVARQLSAQLPPGVPQPHAARRCFALCQQAIAHSRPRPPESMSAGGCLASILRADGC